MPFDQLVDDVGAGFGPSGLPMFMSMMSSGRDVARPFQLGRNVEDRGWQALDTRDRADFLAWQTSLQNNRAWCRARAWHNLPE